MFCVHGLVRLERSKRRDVILTMHCDAIMRGLGVAVLDQRRTIVLNCFEFFEGPERLRTTVLQCETAC